MKQTISFLFAGILGGLMVLGGQQLLIKNSVETAEQTVSDAPTKQISFGEAKVTSKAVNVPFDFKQAANVAMPAVVHIEAAEVREETDQRQDDFFGLLDMFNQPKQGSGSGVIYTQDGYIITNNHVVEFADELIVTLYDNRQFEAVKVGTYPKADLAVLKIEAKGLPSLELSNSDNAEIGEWVLAIGNPFNLTSTVTAGIISAKGRSINAIGGGGNPFGQGERINDAIESFIQTDAAVNPGNSGGALVDAEGKLLGINTAIATRTGSFAGYSFAIPINLAKRIADDIIEFGDYKRGMLGVSIAELDSEYREELKLDISQGVVIAGLTEGGAAEYAGLQPKDVIVEVDNKPIKSVPELQEIIGRAKVGDTVEVKVYRNGYLETIAVVLKAG